MASLYIYLNLGYHILQYIENISYLYNNLNYSNLQVFISGYIITMNL